MSRKSHHPPIFHRPRRRVTPPVLLSIGFWALWGAALLPASPLHRMNPTGHTVFVLGGVALYAAVATVWILSRPRRRRRRPLLTVGAHRFDDL